VFIDEGSFSFAKSLDAGDTGNPWHYLDLPPQGDVIYGIADQTVIQWGLKLSTGDTIIMRAENGQVLRIVLAGGLESSVFQGHLLIGSANFTRYYPSVSGFSVFLAGGDPMKSDSYSELLKSRLENYGLRLEMTASRLEAFYQVTNTYLSVFTVFGAFGMITGVAGLGFILLRTYNRRRREFALLLASGFTPARIRGMILREQAVLLAAGIIAGVVSAAVSTYPSVSANPDLPWKVLVLMIAGIAAAGTAALYLSTRNITSGSLAQSLRKE
jgi:ABC-type antimicrobial peptide transport system permease subunit